MQYKNKDYNPELHDRFNALTVKQPYANDLVTPAYQDVDNYIYGVKSIEVRSINTKWRGDILICSSASPILPDMQSGVTLGFVELYDVKPISEFTPDDWDKTRIPKDKRSKLTKGYGWLMRNPRRVIEYPIKGQLGIYKLVYTKGDIFEYPQVLKIDKQSRKIINNKIDGKKHHNNK